MKMTLIGINNVEEYIYLLFDIYICLNIFETQDLRNSALKICWNYLPLR